MTTEEHSGGLVVLRWKPGRVVDACSGGLEKFDRALRCVCFGRTVGSRPWSRLRILGRRTGPRCRTGEFGERLGVVARVSFDPGEDQVEDPEE